MTKSFVKYGIVGSVCALVFAAYNVFAAFTPPTDIPPAGNTETPVDVGPDTQIKSGGLSVAFLSSDGAITVGYTSGLCEEDLQGSLSYDETTDKLLLCMEDAGGSFIWQPLN